MSTTKTKKPPKPKVTPAPRGWNRPQTLEDEWRKRLVGTQRYRMSSRLTAGMPDDMKLAIRMAATKMGVSMSEVTRRLIALGVRE